MAITSGRGYAAGAFALEIEGHFAGLLAGVEGGGVFGEVVSSPAGADGVVRKQIGRVGYDQLVVTCGIPEGDWGQWLKAFLEGKAPRHDGAIVFLKYDYTPLRRLEWRHATIASVTFPRLDGASKDAAHLTVAIRPESTVVVPAAGAVKTTLTKTKAWQACNFSVAIPGVDCSRVSSVAALTVSQSHVEDAVGATRVPTTELGPLEVGDLILTVAETGAAGFATWCDDFIVHGNNAKAQEKTATVTCKGPNLKDDLFAFVLQGVGIHRLDPEKQVTGAQAIFGLTASMYCEEAALSLPKPAEPAVPATGPAPVAPADVPTSPRLQLGAPGASRPDPTDIARRLLTTTESEPVTADRQQLRGTDVGRAWAERMATLEELTQLAVAARRDWTAIALPEGHSLIDALQQAGVVPPEHDGGLELGRDSFVEGLLQGAGDTYAEVKTHLDEPERH